MASAPIILVPGFWLGAWAWDEVAATLRADGHDVTALTLPGPRVQATPTDRRSRSADHVDAIVDAIEAADRAGRARRPQRDRVLRATRRATACRSGSRRWSTSTPRPGKRAARPDFAGRREADGLGRASRRRRTSTGSARSRRRRSASAPCRCPAASSARRYELTNDARRDIPSTLIATGFTAARLQEVRRGAPGAGRSSPASRSCATSTWIDLPTSHWPMWSKPAETRADHRRRRERTPATADDDRRDDDRRDRRERLRGRPRASRSGGSSVTARQPSIGPHRSPPASGSSTRFRHCRRSTTIRRRWDIRADGVTVRLLTYADDWYGMSQRDVDAARRGSQGPPATRACRPTRPRSRACW